MRGTAVRVRVTLALVGVTALGLTLAAEPEVAAIHKPQRIISLSLCTDGLLLDLVEPQRITSITYLSRSRTNSYLWSRAAGLPINHGLGEEVLAQAPDLVLAGTYSTPALRQLLKRTPIPLLEVPPADNFEEIEATTREVARAVGEVDRGERLISQMRLTLAGLAATRPNRVIRVAGWSGGGSIPGKGTLFDAILTAAGGVNIAATTRGVYYGSFSIEELLVAAPDVLAYGTATAVTPSLRTDLDQHPLILKAYAHRRVTYPEQLYTCGLPESATAARDLRAALLAASAADEAPP